MKKRSKEKDTRTDTKSTQSELSFIRSDEEVLTICFAGNWRIGQLIPAADEVEKQLDGSRQIRRVVLDTKKLGDWDSSILTFLIKVVNLCTRRNIRLDKGDFPKGIQRLLALASAVPERKEAQREVVRESFLSIIGRHTIGFVRSAGEMLDFIGEAFEAFLRLIAGKARFPRDNLSMLIQETGAQAFPIVSLISLLVGLILAFVGAVQLKYFGAQLYVADLVGIGMVRVMGAVMTGIIMAGRTGAAFAAQLGTMQVNEEIDALTTLGISPMEFLVLPRMIALFLMMPLLCLYADLMGILGGMIVGVGMLDINVVQYYTQTKAAVGLNNLWIGLVHSAVFGVLVALSGCLRGMQCGRSASAVGEAATSAVVTGIVSIVVATAIITLICDVLGV